MTATTRPGYEWWDRLCALPKYSFILGPAGNSVRRVEDKVGNWIEYLKAQAVVDDAQAEINQLRQIISDCAAAVGNGTGVGPTCSLDFMRLLPDEIRAAVTPPAASGAAPADMRESLRWCASVLQSIARELVVAETSSFRRKDLDESKSLKEILDEADAALASREASTAPLTDGEVKRRTAIAFEATIDSDHKGLLQYWYAKGLREGAALASPQVAPAPVNEWNEAIEAAARRIENGSFLHDQSPAKLFANQVVPVIRSMKRAAPVQIAPQPIGYVVERSAFRVSPHGQDAESREWLEFTDDPKEKGAFPVWGSPQVAPAPVMTTADARLKVARFEDIVRRNAGGDRSDDTVQKWRDRLIAALVHGPAEPMAVAAKLADSITAQAKHWAYMERIDNGDAAEVAEGKFAEMVKELAALATPMQPGAAADDARDAARYRFLRDKPLGWRVEHCRDGWATCYGRNQIDAAIDAEILLPSPAAKPAEEQGS